MRKGKDKRSNSEWSQLPGSRLADQVSLEGSHLGKEECAFEPGDFWFVRTQLKKVELSPRLFLGADTWLPDGPSEPSLLRPLRMLRNQIENRLTRSLHHGERQRAGFLKSLSVADSGGVIFLLREATDV